MHTHTHTRALITHDWPTAALNISMTFHYIHNYNKNIHNYTVYCKICAYIVRTKYSQVDSKTRNNLHCVEQPMGPRGNHLINILN